MQNVFSRWLRFASSFFSRFLFLLQIKINDFLKLFEHFQQFLMFSKKVFFVHGVILLSVADVLHHD